MTAPDVPADDRTPSTPVAPPGRARPPIHWLLFAAYPSVYLYAENIGELRPTELLLPLAVTIGLAGLAMVLLSRVVEVRRAAIIVSGLAILLLFHGPIAEAVEQVMRPVWMRLLATAVGVVLVVLFALRLRRGLGSVTRALDVASLVLIAFVSLPIVQQSVAMVTGGEDVEPGPTITASGPGTTRDIWWLVFDRYGSDASIRAQYGIEDNDLGPWLASRGFEVLPEAHANQVRTTASLASTVQMAHLDDLAARMGPGSVDYGPLHRMLADHPVGRFLQAQGYRYTQVGSWFPPTRDSVIADELIVPPESSDFGTLVWRATIVSPLQRLLAPDALDPDQNKAVVASRFQWDQLGRLCREVDRNFVFGHVLLPHPPYVFQADGSIRLRGGSTYEQQLRYTNARIQELVECLQDRPADQQPIIIIQADEGPYPPRYARNPSDFDWTTASPAELVAKFGVLNAMFLPGRPAGSATPAPDMTLVNTFRYVLATYFGADLPLLPDRVYASPKRWPYDQVDITDMIPAPGASVEPMRRPGDPDEDAPDELALRR